MADYKYDSCEPQIVPEIEPYTVEGKTIIVVTVHPEPQRPYFLKSKGKDNGTYIRVGGTTRQAHPVKISLGLSILLGVCLMFSLFGCGMQKLDGDGMVYKPAYVSISQDEAKLMMKDDDGHIIVDVRRADEYAQGHIPGAILIPNESITDTLPEELPDKNQIILVYCRTGRRSKEASQKLADMGYVNVYEFGGIEDWTGEIVTEEESDNSGGEKAKLSFESFDGGGPDFNVVIANEGIVSYETEVKYRSSDHGEMDGSGFDKIITFTGIKPGETTLVVEERSPIADNLDHKYRVTVDDELNVQIELLSVKDINGDAGEGMILVIDGEEYPVEWEENESVEALKELCPLTVKMSMYGGFEQVGALGESLPRNDEQITTGYGDIVLYSGNQIVVFYGSNTWAYTRLGHIDMTQEELTELLGNGDVEITLE